MLKNATNPKQIIFTILTIGIIFFSCSCSRNTYIIKGELKGDVNGQYAYLQLADTCRKKLDSAKIENNRFTFEGMVSDVRFANIYLNRKQKSGKMLRINLPLFLEKGEIKLTAHYDSIQPGMIIFDNYNLQGSPSNDLFSNYMKLSARYDNKDRQLFGIYGNHLANKEAGRDYFERGIALTTQMDSLNAERVRETMDYIRQYANTEAGMVALTKILSLLSLEEIEAAEQLFPEKVKNSATGIYGMDQSSRMKKNAVGATSTDFSLKTPEGTDKLLSDYTGKGDYVLLEFWASWCGPCKKEIPHIKEVLKAYEDVNFRVVGISMDTDGEAWKKAIEEHHINWSQLSDLQGFNGTIPGIFRVRGIPTCILLDPQGRIVHRNARGAWLDRFLIAQWGNRLTEEK